MDVVVSLRGVLALVRVRRPHLARELVHQCVVASSIFPVVSKTLRTVHYFVAPAFFHDDTCFILAMNCHRRPTTNRDNDVGPQYIYPRPHAPAPVCVYKRRF
jgi:hypothetical protein